MNPITTVATVMQNFTICIAQPIRDELELQKGDKIVLCMDKKGKVSLMKAVTSLDELVGIGEKSFRALGGGEKVLKNERKQWNK